MSLSIKMWRLCHSLCVARTGQRYNASIHCEKAIVSSFERILAVTSAMRVYHVALEDMSLEDTKPQFPGMTQWHVHARDDTQICVRVYIPIKIMWCNGLTIYSCKNSPSRESFWSAVHTATACLLPRVNSADTTCRSNTWAGARLRWGLHY